MEYAIVKIDYLATTLNDVINGLENGSLIGVYDNLMLLSKHVYDEFGHKGTNTMINVRQRVYNEMFNKKELLCTVHGNRDCTIVIVNPHHEKIKDYDFNFIKAFIRNEKINQLILD